MWQKKERKAKQKREQGREKRNKYPSCAALLSYGQNMVSGATQVNHFCAN